MKIRSFFLSPILLLLVACNPSNPYQNSSASKNDALQGSEEKNGLPTVMEQSENPIDRMITKKIRLALIEDDDLSVVARNIRIITNDGVVTLIGTIKNPTENAKIEKIVAGTVGVKRLNNKLEVSK